MKMLAKNEFREMEVEIITKPTLHIEELEIATKYGINCNVFVSGNHKWLHLETTTDMSPFYGECFDMKSEEWEINTCYVCKDKSIYFRHALLIKKE